MNVLVRGMLSGAGFGLAVLVVEGWVGVIGLMLLGIGSPRSAMLLGALLEIALGLAIGLLASPLLRVRGGRQWHLLALAAVWCGLILYAGLPHFTLEWVMTFLGLGGGLLLVIVARWVARRRPWLPAAAGSVAVLAAMITPDLRAWMVAPEGRTVETTVRASAGAPDIVLIIVDTARADHMGAYGYARQTTPFFDALAEESALFLDATAPATWSLPSHASLFTGRFPSAHQAHAEHHFLDGSFPTLAESLVAAGYETRCFTANAWISDSLGLMRGFMWSDDAWRKGAVGRIHHFAFRLLDKLGFGPEDKGGSNVATNFEDWARGDTSARRPTFAFLNFIESHIPYHQVPDAYLALFTDTSRAELRDLSLELLATQFGGEPPDPKTARGRATDMYDAGLRYADYLVGRVVEALRQRGSLNRTILIVTSDHGELLGEHGNYGHGRSIHEEETRVPLLVRFPPRVPPGARVPTPVSTVGIYATVMDLAGLKPPATLQVGSLIPAIAGGPSGGPVISERYAWDESTVQTETTRQPDSLLRRDVRFRSYRVGQQKLVEASGGTIFFFDLVDDPGELQNRAKERARDVARLRSELNTWQAAIGLAALDTPLTAGEVPDLDPDARERLHSLGYVQ